MVLEALPVLLLVRLDLQLRWMMTAIYKILKTYNFIIAELYESQKQGGIAEYLQLHQKQCRRERNMQPFRLKTWQIASYCCMIISKMKTLNTVLKLDIFWARVVWTTFKFGREQVTLVKCANPVVFLWLPDFEPSFLWIAHFNVDKKYNKPSRQAFTPPLTHTHRAFFKSSFLNSLSSKRQRNICYTKPLTAPILLRTSILKVKSQEGWLPPSYL